MLVLLLLIILLLVLLGLHDFPVNVQLRVV